MINERKLDLLGQRRIRILTKEGFERQWDGTYKKVIGEVTLIWCERFKAGIAIASNNISWPKGNLRWLNFVELMNMCLNL